jgi:hypothetical protein
MRYEGESVIACYPEDTGKGKRIDDKFLYGHASKFDTPVVGQAWHVVSKYGGRIYATFYGQNAEAFAAAHADYLTETRGNREL